MIVKDILNKKGRAIYGVASDTAVFDALKLLVEKNIGAIIVLDNGLMSGIFSERDYARKVVLLGRSSRETPIADIMTVRVIAVKETDSLEHCMSLMSDNKIRHLPVVADDNDKIVVGVLSISDIVRAIIEQQKQTIEHLHQYIQS